MSILGNRVTRTEDRKLLTIGGSYVADLELPGAAWVVYARSTTAHGRIRLVEAGDARSAPGVLDVVTAADVDLPPLCPPMEDLHPGMVRPWLAGEVVRYVGEPVAAVVAETRAQAVDAAELVTIDYDPLPVVVDPEAALSGDVLLWPELGTNVAHHLGETGDGAQAGDSVLFEGCEVVVRQRINNQRVAPCPLEVRSVVARWEEGGRLSFWASTQAPHGLRDGLARHFGLDAAQVRVVAPDVGGGFGAKGSPYPDEILVAWLARRVDRPLRWLETRSESMVALGHGRGQVQYVELGGSRDGRVTAYRLTVVQDAGAYPDIGAFLPELTRVMLTGVYDIARAAFSSRSVVTNTTPTVAYRGAGRPEAAAAIERAMDCFAAEVGMDPAELRRRNLVPAHAFPYTTPTGTTYDIGDYAGALDRLLVAGDYAGLRREQQRRRQAGAPCQLGIGLSAYVEITNGVPGGEFGSVEVHTDGTATVLTGTSPHGQGHATAWSMLVSEALGVPMDAVTVVHGDTDRVTRGIGTFASRSLQTGGVAASQAAGAVVERARALAADLLEADPADVVLDRAGQRFHLAGAPYAPGRSRTWGELASAAATGRGAPGPGEGGPPGSGGRDRPAAGGGSTRTRMPDDRLAAEVDFEPPGATFPFGAHMAVVEVDTETGQVVLQRLVAVDDAGRLVNPLLAEGQVHGGLAQGVAQALMEEVRYDEDGNPLTANLADYAFITSGDLPSFETIHMETPTPLNELGAKGIGESGTIGSTPAVHNAVVDALSHLGVRHVDMPASPERVWLAITSAPPRSSAPRHGDLRSSGP